MIVKKGDKNLARLYSRDETAWLEQTAGLIKEQKYRQLDYKHLAEYLTDMAIRDRREVMTRLTLLLMHVLKWEYQPTHRSGSWRSTIIAQRNELNDMLASGTLRNHAEKILETAYARAVSQAAVETEINEETFPAKCPFTLEQLLAGDEGR